MQAFAQDAHKQNLLKMTKISNNGMYDLEKIKLINYYHCDDKYLLNSQF